MARGGMNHLGVTVRDLAASEARFYRPVLEFLGYSKVEDIPGQTTLWFNAEAAAAVNLWQAKSAFADHEHMRYAPGFHHFAFAAESRDDVDELYRLMMSQGMAVLDPPDEYLQYAPGYYAVYFEDPDGLKFEFVHMPAVPD